MTSNIRGPLTNIKNLAEEARGIELTRDNKAKFRVVISKELEQDYRFCSLSEIIDPGLRRELDNEEQLELFRKFGKCMDKFIDKDITAVECFFRPNDHNDKTTDPVGGKIEQVRHFMVEGDKFRIHGYYNQEGYFVIKRLDWCHLYHLRSDRASKSKS